MIIIIKIAMKAGIKAMFIQDNNHIKVNII